MVVVDWAAMGRVEMVVFQEWQLLIIRDRFLYKGQAVVQDYWCNLWEDRVDQQQAADL